MEHLTKKDKLALKMFKERLLKEFPDQVQEIKLFGSKARGEAAKHSDVDVLVVMKNAGHWPDRSRVHAIANKIFLETEVDLSPKMFTPELIPRLRAHGSPFMQNIDKEGVVI